MEDVTLNRLARGPRERTVNRGNCLHWEEVDGEDGDDMIVCTLDGVATAETDHCGSWKEA